MKQTLTSIIDLADIAGSPELDVTTVPVHRSAPRYEIHSAWRDDLGKAQTLHFGTDSAAAYLIAASVTTAPELASGVLQLLRMAENLPDDADENARAFAKAVIDLVASLPEVENGGQVAP